MRLDNVQNDVIPNFRQQLERLHNAFIDEDITNFDISIQHILGRVEPIGELLEDHGM